MFRVPGKVRPPQELQSGRKVYSVKYLSVDVEISDEFELQPGEELDKYAPFHISVAATVDSEGKQRLWYSKTEMGTPALNMDQQTARELLAELLQKQRAGYRIFAWNGLGFDLRWIGYNAGEVERAALVALKLYDPMFQFFNQRGFPVGLTAVGKAMGVRRTKIMEAAEAPKEWRAGNHQRVMDYVVGDCQITNEIVEAIRRRGRIAWQTSRGTISSEPMPRFKTVAEVLREPEPDQSWMRKAGLKRSKFAAWLPKKIVAEYV